MRKYLITTPRVGGTAYGRLLADTNSVQLFNEPFAFYNVKFNDSGVIVGNNQLPALCSSTKFVVHTQASQFMDNFNQRQEPPPEDILFLERRDKWAQLLSYCITFSLYNDSKEFHNLSLTEQREITVEHRLVTLLAAEWSMYSLLKKQYPTAPVVYYEDIVFPENFPLVKNRGFENITITNLNYIATRFEYIWKYYPMVCAE